MSASKLPAFDYYEPATTGEAAALLAAHGDQARVLAGGVDLLPRMRAGSVRAGHVVNLQRITGLDYMRGKAAAGIEFGAMVTLHALEMWDELATGYRALYDAIHQITSVQTKCMGTAVGNLCVATPASDVAPALAAYNAELLISGPNGDRQVAMADFYPAYGKMVLGLGELVTGVEVPPVPGGHGAAFLNLVRTHADIAKVTVTAAVVLNGGACTEARIALGSIAPTMFRARKAEALLEGCEPSEELILQAAAVAAAQATPIDDVRSTAAYRKATAEVLVARALRKACERARAAMAGPAGNPERGQEEAR